MGKESSRGRSEGSLSSIGVLWQCALVSVKEVEHQREIGGDFRFHMPSLSSLSNPIVDQNPIRNDLFHPLETNNSLSFNAENPKGKSILVDLNDPNPYPREFLPLIGLNRNLDLDLNNMVPHGDTYLLDNLIFYA